MSREAQKTKNAFQQRKLLKTQLFEASLVLSTRTRACITLSREAPNQIWATIAKARDYVVVKEERVRNTSDLPFSSRYILGITQLSIYQQVFMSPTTWCGCHPCPQSNDVEQDESRLEEQKSSKKICENSTTFETSLEPPVLGPQKNKFRTCFSLVANTIGSTPDDLVLLWPSENKLMSVFVHGIFLRYQGSILGWTHIRIIKYRWCTN